jgi:hypothetical protein
MEVMEVIKDILMIKVAGSPKSYSSRRGGFLGSREGGFEVFLLMLYYMFFNIFFF